MVTAPPRELEQTFISSITSLNLEKLVFAPSRKPFGWVFFTLYWASFDDMICGLVDRLRVAGNEHTLVVEFQTRQAKEMEAEVYNKKFLPKFKEKGQVGVVEVLNENDRVWT